ncbi:hypothetical protein NLI96_g5487 [Meripilus lineatus]|uniref:Uncharacterized protein n=1 Tax=Meripilus lineatus TaxID=2056292 RepID=A0AAD5V2T5_9APHY|nr:hypothetical protein NLI96_g5487 [Physisporinus lineatus]
MYAHGASSSHIPQPPHSAGLSYKGLRAAIDPHQIPSPIEVIEADKETWERTPYTTLPGSHVPLSTTEYVAIDQGNSSPKFVRVSTWNVPSTSRLASECRIPMAAIIQPFAPLDPREEPVPLVDTGEAGPARCARCRGYINAWCTWVAGGNRWKCNLCQHETDVHPDYFCGLDANLLRLDHAQRPELLKGTVDFTVSQEYWAPHPPPRISPLFQPILPAPSTGHRIPQPLDYVFILEVSTEAICSGFARSACESISRILYGSSPNDVGAVEPCFPAASRICIMTFDTTLHFYDLTPTLEAANMLVVADLDDVFVPTVQGLFVDPQESRPLIEKLLTSLSQREEFTTFGEAALGSALVGGLAALSGRGGQIVAFTCTLPTIGHGALTPRGDESTLYDTDKESTLFIPRNDTWENIAVQCSEEGIGVSMFLGMSKVIDVASIGVVASGTGGELFFHPRFDPTRDGPVLSSQLHHLLTRQTIYNAVMKIRCSHGLRISKVFGNYYENPASDIEFGVLDEDKAVSVQLEHTGQLDDRRYAFFAGGGVVYDEGGGEEGEGL